MSESWSSGQHSRRALLRISVHGIGGRLHEGEAEVRLERDGKASPIVKPAGAAFAEGEVEPGTYSFDVVAGDLAAPRRQVVVGAEGKTASAYLGEPGWPFYRLGENAIPIPPPIDLLAVAFPTGKPDPDTAKRQAEEIARRLKLTPHPLPDAGAERDRATGEAGEFETAGGAIWLFRFPGPATPSDRRDAAKVIRGILGEGARIGVPVDLLPRQVKVLDNRFVVRFRDGVGAETIEQLVRDAGGTVRRGFRQARNARLIELPEGDLLANLATVEDWYRRDLLVYGEPDVMAEITDDIFPDTAPNDPTFATQANLTLQQVDAAWRIMQRAGANLTAGSPAVHVGTLDRGVDLDHPDIGGNLTDGTPQIARSFDFSGMREMTAAGYAPDTSHGMGSTASSRPASTTGRTSPASRPTRTRSAWSGPTSARPTTPTSCSGPRASSPATAPRTGPPNRSPRAQRSSAARTAATVSPCPASWTTPSRSSPPTGAAGSAPS